MQSRRKSADETTRVVFRRYSDGQIIALFPDVPWSGRWGEVASYMHIGQHGAADYSHVVTTTKPASEKEYTGLLNELRRVGYNHIKVIKLAKLRKDDGRKSKKNT